MDSILIFVYIIQLVAAQDLKMYQDSDFETNSIIQCLSYIAKEHQIIYKPTAVIYNADHHRNVQENILLNAFVNSLIKDLVPLMVTKDLNGIHSQDSNFLIFIFYKNCTFLLKSDIEYNAKNRYIIIIEQLFSDCKKVIWNVSEYLKTLDVTFFIQDIFITMIPEIDEITCTITEKGQLVQINACNNGPITKNLLNAIFPSKIPLDYKKCPFKIGLATMYPYSMINNRDNLTNLDPVYNARGSDVEMTKIMADKINATPHLYFIYTVEENAYLHMEYLEFLLNGSLDACAGGLYRIYGDIVEYSGIYSRQTIVWVYYVERDIRSWQALVRKVNGLYYFLLFYICFTLVWKFISLVDHQAIPLIDLFLYGWGALIGAASLPDAQSLKKKLISIVYLIMSLHLSAYISAQMYSYLTIEDAPQTYKTIDELRESDQIPYLRLSAKYFVNDQKHEAFANASKECNNFYDCLEAVIKHKGSTILLESYLVPFQAFTAINDEARVLSVPQSILIVYHEMIIKKHHPLAYNIRYITTKLFEAGICQKLYDDAIGISTVHKSEIFSQNIMTVDSSSCGSGCAITLAQSAGAFYVWIFGCILSFCIFIVEVLLRKSKKMFYVLNH